MKKAITLDYMMTACKTFFNRLTNYISNPVFLQTRTSIPSHQQIATLKRTQYTKYGIPEPPKKPKTAFFKFKEIELPQIRKDNPGLVMAKVLRILGDKWAEYPEEKKENLKLESRNDFDKYKETYSIYKTSLTPEQLETMEKTKKKIELKKIASTLNKKRKEMDKPKRPANPYNMYCRDKYETFDNSISFKERITSIASSWKTENLSVKNKYKEQYQKNMIEYNINLKDWEQKMADAGHFDLLGTKKLRKLHKQFQEKAKS
ncbi:transcription factor A, mitochondrial [Leptopilina heterotoma]|uniref:transcription factor A, mitochondrial n=1 Tax=Leptopilina heterotoma TaxID=63436 RepID=UPI001CA9FF3F|nr:transcription factor A, mitochondrial [Leptopilina heterotoma]